MVKCSKCGTENPIGDNFCVNCGNQLQTTRVEKEIPIYRTATPRQKPGNPQRLWSGIVVLILVLGGGVWYVKDSQAKSTAREAASRKERRMSQSESVSASLRAEERKQKETESKSASKSTAKSKDDESASDTQNTTADSHQLSSSQKQLITTQFLEWAAGRAKTGNMAVSDYYFDHGAAGQGDWYANTPDGQIQVQNNQQPGASHFKIHAIGGVIFYTAKDGLTGIDSSLDSGSFAEGYSINLDSSQPVSKYLLGDNGIVYEWKTGNGTGVSQTDGFGEKADDQLAEYHPKVTFAISDDQAATSELRQLIQAIS